jgi:hypothetical protein
MSRVQVITIKKSSNVRIGIIITVCAVLDKINLNKTEIIFFYVDKKLCLGTNKWLKILKFIFSYQEICLERQRIRLV